MRKFLKIAGISIASILIAVGAYVGLLFYPSVLFSHHIDYKNFRVHSEDALDAVRIQQILDDVDAALATSEIYDPAITHNILLGHDNGAFALVQDLAWWLFTQNTRPVFTYNRAAPPSISQIITFRVPDFERDLLVHPEARFDMGMTHDFTHEAVHTLVSAQIGAGGNFSLPEWKREGYPEYVASSVSILSDPDYEFGESVERILAEDLSWMTINERDSSLMRLGCPLRSTIRDEAGHWRLTCYYISRVLVEYLLDVEDLTVHELMRPGISPTETFQDLISAYRSGQL